MAKYYTFLKPLNEMSLQEYQQAKSSGMFWVWYPDATGNVDKDLDTIVVKECRIYKYLDIPKRHFYDILDTEAEYDW